VILQHPPRLRFGVLLLECAFSLLGAVNGAAVTVTALTAEGVAISSERLNLKDLRLFGNKKGTDQRGKDSVEIYSGVDLDEERECFICCFKFDSIMS
jgi:hypothetical protein